MALTEDEAAGRTCQLRAIVVAVYDVLSQLSQYDNVYCAPTGCMGRDCMHWEWQDPPPQTKTAERVRTRPRRGDCALKRG